MIHKLRLTDQQIKSVEHIRHRLHMSYKQFSEALGLGGSTYYTMVRNNSFPAYVERAAQGVLSLHTGSNLGSKTPTTLVLQLGEKGPTIVDVVDLQKFSVDGDRYFLIPDKAVSSPPAAAVGNGHWQEPVEEPPVATVKPKPAYTKPSTNPDERKRYPVSNPGSKHYILIDKVIELIKATGHPVKRVEVVDALYPKVKGVLLKNRDNFSSYLTMELFSVTPRLGTNEEGSLIVL